MTSENYQAQLAENVPQTDLPWLADMRQGAADRFASTGLPDRKVEAWRYTNLKPIRAHLFDLSLGQSVNPPPALLADSLRLVFADGQLVSCPDNLPAGVRLDGMARTLAEDPGVLNGHLHGIQAIRDLPLPALNNALSRDGYVLILEPGVKVAEPIEILFLSATGATYPRNLILAGAGAQASIVEHYLGTDDCDGDYLVNSVTEVYAATGARLKRYKIQQDNPATSHIATLAGQLAADAVLENFDLNLGAKLARSEIHMALQGKGADVSLSGVYLLRDKQHCDNAILMDHVVGGTNSYQDYRGILDDKAHGVFQGKITVQPDAQGIEGHQLNRTLLLSDRAEMDSKPELEIRADDVKCSHGATIGELDETGLFYLRTRGIPEAEARQLLMTAFIVETLGHIDDDAIRGVMDALVSDWMAA